MLFLLVTISAASLPRTASATTAIGSQYILDDLDSFTAYKSGGFDQPVRPAHESPSGFRNHMYWVYKGDCGADSFTHGKWEGPPAPADGYYRVEAYIPQQNASAEAQYVVLQSAPRIDYKTIDQSRYSDQWAPLGRVYLNAARFQVVFFYQNTGPCDQQYQIGIDAVRFTYLGNRTKYVALGDSYSSGEGAPAQSQGGFIVDGVNTDAKGHNECHRSTKAYSQIVSVPIPVDRTFAACSGALTDHYSKQNTQIKGREPPQRRYVDPNTDRVTLTFGGNDVYFPQVVSFCATATSCHLQFRRSIGGGSIDLIENYINGLFPTLANLYSDLRERSEDNAAVFVLGYPRFIETNAAIDRCVNGLSNEEVRWINERLVQMNDVIETATRRAGVRYIDVERAIPDENKVCGPGTDAVNGLSKPPVSQLAYSFHPNVLGHEFLMRKLAEDSMWRVSAPANRFPDATARWSGDYDASAKVALESLGWLDGIVRRFLRIQETGLTPLQSYSIFAYSDPVLVGEFRADSQGTLDIDLPLPPGLESGLHSLKLEGPSPQGGTLIRLGFFFVEEAQTETQPTSSASPSGPVSAVASTPVTSDSMQPQARRGHAVTRTPNTGANILVLVALASLLLVSGFTCLVAQREGRFSQ